MLMIGIVILLLNPSVFQRIFASNHSLFELLFFSLDDFLLEALLAAFAFLCQSGIAFPLLGIVVFSKLIGQKLPSFSEGQRICAFLEPERPSLVKDSAHQRPSLVKDSAGSRSVHPRSRIVLRVGSCPSPYSTSSTPDPDDNSRFRRRQPRVMFSEPPRRGVHAAQEGRGIHDTRGL